MISWPQKATQLLVDCSNSNQAALEQLPPLLNAELRRLAGRYMHREDPGHTLQTSVLVNEAYLRLIDQQHEQGIGRAQRPDHPAPGEWRAAKARLRRMLTDEQPDEKPDEKNNEA